MFSKLNGWQRLWIVVSVVLILPCLSSAQTDNIVSENSTSIVNSGTNTSEFSPSDEEHIQQEARDLALKAADEKNIDTFSKLAKDALHHCTKLTEWDKESECIKAIILGSIPLSTDNTPKIAKITNQKRHALEKVIIDVYSVWGEKSNFALFYNAADSTYSQTFPPNIKNAYYYLTRIASSERKIIGDEELIQMYEYFTTTFPGGLPFGGEILFSVYPFKTPSTLNIRPEIQLATTEGCKRCEERYIFSRCKDLCVEAFVIEAVEKRGEHWHYFGESTSGDVSSFYGIVKVIKKSPRLVQVWVRSEPMRTYEDINSFSMARDFSHDLMLWQFNCFTSEMNTKNYISYGPKGETLNSNSTETSFEPIVPQSLGEMVFDLVCKKKK